MRLEREFGSPSKNWGQQSGKTKGNVVQCNMWLMAMQWLDVGMTVGNVAKSNSSERIRAYFRKQVSGFKKNDIFYRKQQNKNLGYQPYTRHQKDLWPNWNIEFSKENIFFQKKYLDFSLKLRFLSVWSFSTYCNACDRAISAPQLHLVLLCSNLQHLVLLQQCIVIALSAHS